MQIENLQNDKNEHHLSSILAEIMSSRELKPKLFFSKTPITENLYWSKHYFNKRHTHTMIL